MGVHAISLWVYHGGSGGKNRKLSGPMAIGKSIGVVPLL